LTIILIEVITPLTSIFGSEGGGRKEQAVAAVTVKIAVGAVGTSSSKRTIF